MIRMTDQVNIIGAFDTSFGKMITVLNDKLYQVGQRVNTNDGAYRIKMIQFSHDPNSNIIALCVEPA